MYAGKRPAYAAVRGKKKQAKQAGSAFAGSGNSAHDQHGAARFLTKPSAAAVLSGPVVLIFTLSKLYLYCCVVILDVGCAFEKKRLFLGLFSFSSSFFCLQAESFLCNLHKLNYKLQTSVCVNILGVLSSQLSLCKFVRPHTSINPSPRRPDQGSTRQSRRFGTWSSWRAWVCQ